jgi:hypothetical protein
MVRWSRAMVAVAGGLFLGNAWADLDDIRDDGWHAWKVRALDSAPAMCCYVFNSGVASRQSCNLDDRRGGFGSDDDRTNTSGEMQIYARLAAGVVQEIRAFSASCPVTANSEIVQLGRVDNESSIDWLRDALAEDEELSSETIMAISMHDGEQARDTVINTGRDHDNPDVRTEAWFWLSQSEATESEREIGNAILNDQDDDVREEAVFALSQLPEDRAVPALVDLIENRSLDMDIRENALFWLAQSESDEAFAYVDGILSSN